MPRPTLTLPAILLALLAAPVFAQDTDDDHDHDEDAHHEAEEGHDDHDDHDDHDEHAEHEDHDDHDDHDDHEEHADHDDHDDHAGHDHDHAHEHGQAAMSLSLQGQLLEAELTLPGGDLFPEDTADADKTIATASALFDAAGLGLALPEAAGCETITFAVSVTEIDEGEHEGHADYTARRVSLCADPAAIDQLGLTAFTAMPALEGIDLMLDAPGFFLEAELTPEVTGILMQAPLTY